MRDLRSGVSWTTLENTMKLYMKLAIGCFVIAAAACLADFNERLDLLEFNQAEIINHINGE